MSILTKIIILLILIFLSAFLSMAEISLASARKIKLQIMLDEGNEKAKKVLEIQEFSGNFFTVIQICINAVAILGGIIGDNILSPYVTSAIEKFAPNHLDKGEIIGSVLSFIIITSFFIEFADLIPKRLAMVAPERVAIAVINPMVVLIKICKPIVYLFNSVASFIFKFFKIPEKRNDSITHDDIFAVVDAGADAGVVQPKEHLLIENIFELGTRWVTSIMTTRDNIIYFTLKDSEDDIKEKIANSPHSKFVLCKTDLDSIIGYVSSKDILPWILKEGKNLFTDIEKINTPNILVIPNTLTLSEALDKFNEISDDFAVIINEYGHVVGVVTLNDVINTLMGDIVYQNIEEQLITSRDENSWLIDGITPIEEVKKALEIETFPEEATYETISGFMIYMLKTIPKKSAKVKYNGYTFEIVDVDNFKVDQLLVVKNQ
ncbi:hemolysin family protein [Fusobacterium sp. PH5-44]|uniref:hemolysin family protein n=1 Tax=unclassified Fusobacterium TaxID=2648384 RepID=UPI003D1DEA0B